MDPIYLDYNATTPIAPEVVDAMLPYLRGLFGNPSSTHPYGVAARQGVDRARAQVAGLLGCRPDEVIFTSGGTESNNHALIGTLTARQDGRDKVIISAVEHPAITQVCNWLVIEGYDVDVLPVDGTGMVCPDDLRRAIDGSTALVSVMHANNEVGTVQPIAELAAIAHEHGALFHTDAAQSLGKLPVRVDELGVDLLTVAGHKLYAPKGIGALYVRDGVALEPFMHGAGQEAGRRPGTENVLEMVGLGCAAEVAGGDLEANMTHYRAMRDRLHRALVGALGEDMVRLNGHPTLRLPNTLNLSFRGVQANVLLDAIGERVAASAGAACHADQVSVSAVIAAMGVPDEWAMGTVRLSTGRGNTAEQIDKAADVIADAVQALIRQG